MSFWYRRFLRFGCPEVSQGDYHRLESHKFPAIRKHQSWLWRSSQRWVASTSWPRISQHFDQLSLHNWYQMPSFCNSYMNRQKVFHKEDWGYWVCYSILQINKQSYWSSVSPEHWSITPKASPSSCIPSAQMLIGIAVG